MRPSSVGGKKLLFAVNMDAATQKALCAAADAVAFSPSACFGDVAAGGSFEAVDESQLHMDFVLCNGKIASLFEDQACTLQTALQTLIENAAVELEAPMPFLRFELFQPDPTVLVARFRVPERLTSLRKAVWRECKSMGLAFPDAMWMPHVKLGKFKGLTRGQLAQLSCSGFSEHAPREPTRVLGLKLVGDRPESFLADWEDTLSFSLQPKPKPQPKEQTEPLVPTPPPKANPARGSRPRPPMRLVAAKGKGSINSGAEMKTADILAVMTAAR